MMRRSGTKNADPDACHTGINLLKDYLKSVIRVAIDVNREFAGDQPRDWEPEEEEEETTPGHRRVHLDLNAINMAIELGETDFKVYWR
jgi:hypothetical protein